MTENPEQPAKRKHEALPPEEQRPRSSRTGRPLSATEMYAQRYTGRMPPAPELWAEKLSELRKRVADIQEEVPHLESTVKLLPDEHPMRRQAQMRLGSLRINLRAATDELQAEEAVAQTKALASDIARTRDAVSRLERELVERIRGTEEKVKASPAEVAGAIRDLTAGDQRLKAIERHVDTIMRELRGPVPPAAGTEETTPEAFRIIEQRSPVTRRISGFVVEDPKGNPVTKWRDYVTQINEHFPGVTIGELENARVEYTTYRAIFALGRAPFTAGQPLTRQPAVTEMGTEERLAHYGVPASKYQQVIDLEGKYTLDQLRGRCRQKGLTISGDKYKLVWRLIEAGALHE